MSSLKDVDSEASNHASTCGGHALLCLIWRGFKQRWICEGCDWEGVCHIWHSQIAVLEVDP